MIPSTYEDYYERIVEANSDFAQYHLTNILFTPRWWLLVGITIVPWIIWLWYSRNKPHAFLAFLAVGLSMFINVVLDNIGVMLGLWEYPVKIFPIMLMYIPWSCSVLPVTLLFILQYKPLEKQILKAILYSLASSYIGEPVVVSLGLYKLILWEYYYSLPIYFIIFLTVFHLHKKLLTLAGDH